MRGILVLFVCVLLAGGVTVIRQPNGDASTGAGLRPRNVATRDGVTLVTSMGGDCVMQVVGTGPGATVTPIPTAGPSWDVCFVDDDHAVVTHPTRDRLTVLARTGGVFAVEAEYAVPYYCTEVIHGPSGIPELVYIANRGAAPAGAASWQHSVLEFDWTAGDLVRTIPVEREPSALALSPDETILFVGHVQGALGGDGIPAHNETPRPGGAGDNQAAAVYDGGSILGILIENGDVRHRFPVGSPVRDVAVWPPDGTTPGNAYRLYFTHVGDGAQSESPGFGGRGIANVVSTIRFQVPNHTPVSRDDFVFYHDPEFEPPNAFGALPAVLPEQVAFRPAGGGWELWVTQSASGTVSRAPLDAQGRLLESGTLDVRSTPNIGQLYVVDADNPRSNPNTLNQVPVPAGVQDVMTTVYRVVSGAQHYHLGASASLPNVFTSNPRGVAYDSGADLVLVANRLEHTLAAVNPGNGNVVRTALAAVGTGVSADERNFFTFGRGFDFRDTEEGVTPANMVNNLSCGTCHVNGHLDGKVRITVANGSPVFSNRTPGADLEKLVAVPSPKDAGLTEWIFFEGNFTIRDGEGVGSNGETDYMANEPLGVGFFSNTDNFTKVLSTSITPTAPDGSLDTAEQWGRFYFQKMNCTRCHGGPLPGQFTRTVQFAEDELDFPKGPLPSHPAAVGFPSGNPGNADARDLTVENRLLHDATQSFITTDDGADVRNRHSRINMTDVGTRTYQGQKEAGIQFPGVNTPALAGAWDNAPYFHDGRYRTLEEVLDHTWLILDGNQRRAAPLFVDGSGQKYDPADNADNNTFFGTGPIAIAPQSLHPFGTHSAESVVPGAYQASGWLNSLPTGVPGVNARDAVLAFLRAVSSETDLCPPVEVTGFTHVVTPDCNLAYISWQTSVPIVCQVSWTATDLSGGGSGSTPENITHGLLLDIDPGKTYDVTITTDLGASPPANTPPCRNVDEYAAQFDAFPCQHQDPPQELQTALVGVATEPGAGSRIAFSLRDAGPVQIRIHDVAGRLVRTLVDRDFPAGEHALAWNGDADAGGSVASGVYYVLFRAGAVEGRDRIVITR